MKKEISKKESKIQELQKKCDEYLEGWRRAKADYENLKKRLEKEKEDTIKFANLNLMIGLVPVYNNFKLSFKHLPDNLKDNNWVIGIKHIEKQLAEVLAYNGLEEIIPAAGDEFKPELHEAVKEAKKEVEEKVEQAEVEEKKLKDKKHSQNFENKVVKVLSNGYKINGKVFIPAKVIVK